MEIQAAVWGWGAELLPGLSPPRSPCSPSAGNDVETTAFGIGVMIIQFYGTLEIIEPFPSTEARNLGAQMPSAIVRPTLILQLGKLRPLDRNRPSISLLGQKPVLTPPDSIVFPL